MNISDYHVGGYSNKWQWSPGQIEAAEVAAIQAGSVPVPESFAEGDAGVKANYILFGIFGVIVLYSLTAGKK